jgi:hypothetical protein
MRLIEMAVQANADPDRLEKLINMEERWELRQAAEAYGVALAEFQAECPPIHKGRTVDLGRGSGPRYAGLDDIMAVAQPLLSKHGLSVSYSADISDGKLHAVCKVRKGLHTETNEITLPVPDQMRVNDTQKMGAAFSYAKRYALCAALNITVTDQDVDGAGLEFEPITDNQAFALDELLSQLDGEAQSGFKKWMGVKEIGDIPASKYKQALAALKKKVTDANS